ncbi:MAG: hypothetical protein EOO88_32020 [Pedobacter sp.]|nr:MAG: hypothetical protein EOO88_32020 [Pedobacter sp.]
MKSTASENTVKSHHSNNYQVYNTLILALLIMLFVYAASSKILDYDESRHQMLNQVFPKPISLILLWLVPITELLISLMICIKKTRLIGLYAYLATMFAFTVYIILVMNGIFGRIPCSCGGAIDTLSWKAHLMLNIVFILLTLLSIMFTKKENKSKKNLASKKRKPVSRKQADKDAAL